MDNKIEIPEGTRLTPVRFSRVRGTHQYWLYRCTCGNEKEIRKSHFTRREVRSCGCLQKEFCRDINERLTPDSYVKGGLARRGKATSNKGKICVYQHQNKKVKGSKRKYLTQEELDEVWRGERELVWD